MESAEGGDISYMREFIPRSLLLTIPLRGISGDQFSQQTYVHLRSVSLGFIE